MSRRDIVKIEIVKKLKSEIDGEGVVVRVI